VTSHGLALYAGPACAGGGQEVAGLHYDIQATCQVPRKVYPT